MRCHDYSICNGEDHSPVARQDYEVPIKSIGHGITTREDLENSAEVWNVMLSLMQDVGHKLRVYEKNAGGVAIDIRNCELSHKQWQCQLPAATHSTSILAKEAFSLFSRSYRCDFPIRSVTVRAINLSPQSCPQQIDLFTDYAEINRRERIESVVENIRDRFGKYAIMPAALCRNIKMPTDREIELRLQPACRLGETMIPCKNQSTSLVATRHCRLQCYTNTNHRMLYCKRR